MLKARSPFRALAKNRTISPPPPSRQGRLFPPCRGTPLISLCVLRGRLVRRPVELGSVDPHTVQNDRELPRDGDLGLAEAVSLGELGSPSLQSRPFGHTSQQNAGRFEEIHAQHGVTALRDSAGPIDFPGGMASGRQSNIGVNTSRSLQARRIVDRRLETQCGDRADTRYGHEPADLHIIDAPACEPYSVIPVRSPHARARGGADSARPVPTDLHRPARRRCGCWPTSTFLFGEIVVRRFRFGATMEVGRSGRSHHHPPEWRRRQVPAAIDPVARRRRQAKGQKEKSRRRPRSNTPSARVPSSLSVAPTARAPSSPGTGNHEKGIGDGAAGDLTCGQQPLHHPGGRAGRAVRSASRRPASRARNPNEHGERG
jgi:hypothetical protein